MHEIALFEQPHGEARRLCATGATVYMTVNPTEYHGPHLSLHNDRLVSRGLCRELHARLGARDGEPLVWGADLELGVEPCPGRGTHHAAYRTTREVVVEACRALAELGARRAVIMTFHGAPLHNLALQAGVDVLAAAGTRALAPFHAVLRELVDIQDVTPYAEALAGIADDGDRAAVLAELPNDFHAGFFETSMALHLAPASVSGERAHLPPCPPVPPDPRLRRAAAVARGLGRAALARELEFAAAAVGWNALRPFPGYTGRPHLASAAAGAVFTRFLMDRLAPLVGDVLAGRADPPRPIMAWMGTVTAGGRVGGLPRPELAEIAGA